MFVGAKLRGFRKPTKKNESQVVPTYGKMFRKVWEVIFRLKIVSRTLGSHFSFEKSFPKLWEVIFRLKNRFPNSGKSFFV
jgi:hypothetical protein